MQRKSAGKKALRVTARRAARNLAIKRQVRDAVRTVRKAVAAKKTDEARTAFTKASSRIQRAVKANVIHRNKAARLTSRLARSIKGS